MDGDHLLVPADVDPKTLDKKWSLYKNKRDLCLEVAMEIANGATFHTFDKAKQFPSARTLFYWYARDTEFKNLIDEARKVQGELFMSKLIKVAEEVDDSNARASKVKADIYRSLMSVNDKERFGQAPKQDAGPPVVNIVFNTGVDRTPLPAEVVVVEPEDS